MANQPNPQYPAYSPQPYIDANGNPTNDPGTGPTAQPNTNVSIGEGAANPQQQQQQQPTTQPAAVPGIGASTAQSSGGLAPGQQGPTGIPGLPGGDAQIDGITLQSRQALAKAYTDADAASKVYTDLQARYADPATGVLEKEQISTQLVGALNNVTRANDAVSTANVAYSSTLDKAMQHATIDPSLAAKYNADSEAARSQGGYYDAQSQVLKAGSQSGIDLAIANGRKANADATNALATAEATRLKAAGQGPEAAALLGQADQAKAQAASITAQIPILQQKADDDHSQAAHTAAATDAQANAANATAERDKATATNLDAQTALQKALIPGAPGQQAATTAQAAGAGAASQAQAQATLEATKAAQQGPLYGLQQKIDAVNAIHQQVFGPGGSGDPQQADDLKNQAYAAIDASLAGTTPYAANVAAANAGLTAFGTQASLANAAGSAAAQRAAALSSFGGSVLGTLGAMNVNAPKGSTALAGAVQNVIDYMSNKMTSGALAQPTQPQAPALPAVLQKLAGLQGQGNPALATGGGSMGGALGGAGAMPAAPTAPVSPNAFLQGAGGAAPQGNTSAPVTINIGGQGQGQGPQAPASPMPPNQGAFSGSMPSTSMPASLQQYAPPTTDFVHSLWSKELGSGAIQSPYAAMTQQIPGPTPMAA